jgi:hypothetical protein
MFVLQVFLDLVDARFRLLEEGFVLLVPLAGLFQLGLVLQFHLFQFYFVAEHQFSAPRPQRFRVVHFRSRAPIGQLPVALFSQALKLFLQRFRLFQNVPKIVNKSLTPKVPFCYLQSVFGVELLDRFRFLFHQLLFSEA